MDGLELVIFRFKRRLGHVKRKRCLAGHGDCDCKILVHFVNSLARNLLLN